MKRISGFLKSPPIILAAITALAYGILASQLGFYWDDLPISWIRYELGQEALTQYFSTNRPAWGVWYGFLTRFIPHTPFPWQIIALFWRWLSSLLIWGIIQQLFPGRKRLALTTSLLFLLYPGFNQQSVSFVYGYHFTVYTLFLFSLFSMLWTLHHPRLAWLITLLALFASAANLIMGEYFFALDLIRPLLLWFALQEISTKKERIRRAFSAWLPYFTIFLAGVAGRTLLFNNQVYAYSLLDGLKAAPFLTLIELIQTVFLSLWTTLIAAWGQAFIPPDFALQGKVTIAIYLVIIGTLFALVFPLLRKKDKTKNKTEARTLLAIGLVSALFAGIPFWLTDLPVSLEFPANRATLPFIFGSVFTLVGVSSLILNKNLKNILLVLLIAFSAGRQFLWADEFRRDWNVQKNFFWQLSWRVPALEEDTLILLNEGALKFYADNSLSAPLNWIYAPDATAENIPYMLFYPRTRFGIEGEKLVENQPLTHDFIAGEFHGNTSQMVLINFSPPGCLHIVDPEIDSENKFISDLLVRDAASFSRPHLILDEGQPSMPDIYTPEPKHGWCYYFEKADLARQHSNWDEVVRLGAQAFGSGDHPNDPTENFVFIEGYALTGDWAQAEQLSLRAYRVSRSYMQPLLCSLWERIEKNAPNNLEKERSLLDMRSEIGCQ
ncbi:MAG: hypothetical protein HN855_07755 [Anaerolineae bacterium]|nr:hypothetical protein [Anaerolineae bacterium]MBT7071747.1 hypothetical protein [Anaerolineae bacterium]MBT7325035.1 hypothetical protein [Anaerolineae bacterium]